MKNQLKRVITALLCASCCVLFNFILNTLMTEVICGMMIGYFFIEVIFLSYVWLEKTEIVFEEVKTSINKEIVVNKVDGTKYYYFIKNGSLYKTSNKKYINEQLFLIKVLSEEEVKNLYDIRVKLIVSIEEMLQDKHLYYYIEDYIVENFKEEHLLMRGRIIDKNDAQWYIDTSSINRTNDLNCSKHDIITSL